VLWRNQSRFLRSNWHRSPDVRNKRIRPEQRIQGCSCRSSRRSSSDRMSGAAFLYTSHAHYFQKMMVAACLSCLLAPARIENCDNSKRWIVERTIHKPARPPGFVKYLNCSVTHCLRWYCVEETGACRIIKSV
jgi:hypothetical protein